MSTRTSSWHPSRPDSWQNLPEGQAVAGFPIGILCIPGVSALIPGNVQNAQTFTFPVKYQVLRDVQFEQIAKGDKAVVPAIVKAAESLVDDGVGAIVGACGSLGHYQSVVANAVAVPVFMSILTQVPLLLNSLGENQSLAIVFATKTAFSPLIQRECGIDDLSRIVQIDLIDCPSFIDMTQGDKPLDGDALLAQIISKVEAEIDDSVGAIMLQCSDLPPFAVEIQHHFGLPVFDMTGLIDWVYRSVVRRPFSGAF
ncbi:MAG: aspartate/glutamate racemase family protein [Gammaproteobacteria bacterium]|nr:aspartate/glutamate racemase family protein [Gammaproteobacteria bacterium]